ncbi:allophanate hydrolase [Alcanivorax sp. N3-2A]|nr:allophanate hydrolase [Alcanivorax sp. N3-2A]
MNPLHRQSLAIAALARAYRRGTFTPADIIGEIHRRIQARGRDGVWTALVPEQALMQRAHELADQSPEALPLYGIPFSLKDNIDAAGLDTTASCPAYAYRPARSARTVALLEAAGAILIGKNTMDQFATGLVGIRAPQHPVNSFNAEYIPGGSSSGSAVAVATGLVSFALGSDTGGSGRIPAALNNIVGLKPTPGLISTAGMVYANRSFDCVPIFALDCADAQSVFDVLAVDDPDDPYQRRQAAPSRPPLAERDFIVGVPTGEQRTFFDDDDAERCFERAIEQMVGLGARIVDVDYAPFKEAGDLLFEGPPLAERLASVGDFVRSHARQCDPVVAAIIEKASGYTAVDFVRYQYRLRELEVEVDRAFSSIDLLMVPTAATAYRIDAVRADPVRLNRHMGHYTYFANLLDLCALAVPAGLRGNGLPFGVCLLAPAGRDRALIPLGSRFQALQGLAPGAPVLQPEPV